LTAQAYKEIIEVWIYGKIETIVSRGQSILPINQVNVISSASASLLPRDGGKTMEKRHMATAGSRSKVSGRGSEF